jgi:hypothetical protein
VIEWRLFMRRNSNSIPARSDQDMLNFIRLIA